MSGIDDDLVQREGAHSSISGTRHTEKVVAAGEHTPATKKPKKSPYVDSIQKSLQTATDGLFEKEYLTSQLRPPSPGSTPQKPPSLFGNPAMQSQFAQQMVASKYGISLGTSEATFGAMQAGQVGQTSQTALKDDPNQPDGPGKYQSLLSIILSILDQILSSQSKTQSTATIASATLATQEYSYSNESATAQYQSDMQNANIEFNTALSEIFTGSVNVVFGTLSGVFAGLSMASSISAANISEESIEELPAESDADNLNKGEGEGEGDAEPSIAPKGSAEAGATDAPAATGGKATTEADKVGTEEAAKLKKAEAKAKAEKDAATKKAENASTKTKLQEKAKLFDKLGNTCSALGQGIGGVQKGITDLSNSLQRQTQAKQAALSALFRALSTLVQTAQQATGEVSRKSGDITGSVLDAIKQAFHSVVDASSMRG
ncbi:MAG: hypothetical protein P4L16_06475 [Chlamydiales bacterium]|nr:hypothetical protein [Chlamydiales bacterium]